VPRCVLTERTQCPPPRQSAKFSHAAKVGSLVIILNLQEPEIPAAVSAEPVTFAGNLKGESAERLFGGVKQCS